MFTRSFNLQDMCLVAIVRDIDLFVYNKTVPQKHIDFLFRVYSDQVFSKHKTLKSSIDEDCMVWFLNPHVKKVTIPAPFYSERVIQQLKIIGSGISSLTLRNSKVSENKLNLMIDYIPNVVHLNLSCTSCSDETLDCIRKSCQELESLNVSFCEKITDYGMENLCGSKLSLKYLNVSFSGVEAFGIAKILNGMPSLECVKSDDNLIDLLYEIGKNNQYNLAELTFETTFLHNPIKVIKTIARICPKLKKLHFIQPIDETVLAACVHFNNLEELKIKSSHGYHNLVAAYDVLTPILPLSKNLKTLILSCVEISAIVLIECFENLENLYLKKVSFFPFKKEDVKISKTNLITLVMKDIDMEVNEVTYEAIVLLISLSKNVTTLQLNHINYLPSEIFNVILQSMKNLSVVNFEYTHITMHSLNQLFEIPTLDSITANCYENGDSANPKLFSKSKSCTLSWCCTYDSDEDIEDNSFEDDTSDSKHCYVYDDDDSDGSDIISDQCNSSDSESAYRFYHFGDSFYDYDPY